MSKQKNSRPLGFSTRLRLGWKRLRNLTLSEDDAYLFSELSDGDIAIDCGANVGVITALMAKTGAEVHAFEPDPNAFSILEKKFKDTKNVYLHHTAVSRTAGEMKLFFREEQPSDPVAYSVGSTLIPSKTDVDTQHHITVPVVSLSKFLSDFGRIRILKLDIEGSECDVLEDLLDTGQIALIDLLLVETHETWIPDQIPRLVELKKRLKAGHHSNVFLNWI